LTTRSLVRLVTLVCLALAPCVGHAAGPATRFPVDVWEPPFNQQRHHVRTEYAPLAQAAKAWQLCASMPHLTPSMVTRVTNGGNAQVEVR